MMSTTRSGERANGVGSGIFIGVSPSQISGGPPESLR